RSLRQTKPGKWDRIPSPALSTADGTSGYNPACRKRRHCGPTENKEKNNPAHPQLEDSQP
ncbi:hypothetical protein, partial [Barnesiella intestinihominis]|uniref:hypothetical protein n=1 Tax=Barnesiella intestinihominis TaxID=487174 RepID=UPI003AB5961E